MTDKLNPAAAADQPIVGVGGHGLGEGSSSSCVKCCSECGLTFSTLAKYKYHRLRLHGAWKAGFPCPDCDATFSSVSNLKRHRKKVHEKETDPPSSGSSCRYCGHVAKDNYHLTVHTRKHTGRMGVPLLVELSQLMYHTKCALVSGERPFECPLCSFRFYKKSDLTKHQKGCGGAKFRCSTCDKPFHFKRQLQEHLVWSKVEIQGMDGYGMILVVYS